MFKKQFTCCILLFLVFSSAVSAQSGYYGNLIRLKFDQQTAGLSDTLGYWEDSGYSNPPQFRESTKIYLDHIQAGNKSYLLKKDEYLWDYGFLGGIDGQYVLENTDGSTARRFSRTTLGTDVIPPYFFMVAPVLKTAGNGCWILNGSLPSAYISSDDSLYDFTPDYEKPDSGPAYRIATLLGEVEGKTLGVFFRHNEPGCYETDFYLVDLGQSPSIDLSKAQKVEFSDYDESYPKEYWRLSHLSGNLYLASTRSQDFNFYSFSGNRFQLIKKVLPDEWLSAFASWNSRNGRLYYYSDNQLVYREFNPSDTSFGEKKTLITVAEGMDISTDRQMKYAAVLKKDILDIYDIDKGAVINTIALTGVTSPRMPIIDSPYVFLHQVKRTVDVKESKGSGTPEAYNMLTAYPNPFNGLAKIRYTLARDQQNISVNVYDILGRRVKTLYTGPAPRGEHEQYFEANDLPTGVYIYSVESPELRMTNKLMLLK